MKTLASLSQLESKLSEAEQKRLISDDEFRRSLSTWCLSPELFGEAPKDPLSSEFTDYQLRIYEWLANKEYDARNEETVFDFDHELRWPYPYSTKSAQTVGIHLIGYGWLIKAMDLPAGSRILEIGSGYGALTIHLASMGYHVTCLDVSSSLLNFTKARTAHLPQQVETICGDMATAEIEGTFDAVIFNASLHHSPEHRAVLRRLDAVLTSNGMVAFAAEPVVPDHSECVPYPWGVRLDGLSVWSITKWGWLELGFQESYFVHLLQDIGWKLRRHSLGLSGQTDVWIANRAKREDSFAAGGIVSDEYSVDLETEVIRLRKLVEGYERGRFIRFARWLKGRF